MARLAIVCEQIKALEQARLTNLEQAPGTGPHAMVRLIANVIGVGIETADMLVQEVLSRTLLIHGARAALGRVRDKQDPRSLWLGKMRLRRHPNVVAVMLANKNARIAWSLLTSDNIYDASLSVGAA
jgi:hypothetical protein